MRIQDSYVALETLRVRTATFQRGPRTRHASGVSIRLDARGSLVALLYFLLPLLAFLVFYAFRGRRRTVTLGVTTQDGRVARWVLVVLAAMQLAILVQFGHVLWATLPFIAVFAVLARRRPSGPTPDLRLGMGMRTAIVAGLSTIYTALLYGALFAYPFFELTPVPAARSVQVTYLLPQRALTVPVEDIAGAGIVGAALPFDPSRSSQIRLVLRGGRELRSIPFPSWRSTELDSALTSLISAARESRR